MGTRDEKLKANLLASFCPILRFDAAEKHFPVCTEAFISCSVLLRRPKNPRQVKAETKRRQMRQAADQQDEDEDEDEGEDEDDADPSADADGDDDDAAARQQREQRHACVKCGQRQGWNIPSKGGWVLVALPSGSESWSASALLEEQRRDRLHEFRLEPHRCIWNGQPGGLSTVPCYAFAELVDPSAMAPFVGRAGLGPVYELKYAFLYGYNGTTFAIPGTSVGVHTGDLEHVTIRVDARRRMILEAFFAAHGTGEGKWVPSQEFCRQVEAWEAAAHPGFTAEVPDTTREFLEVEVLTTAEEAGGDGDAPAQVDEATHAETSGDGVRVGGGERLVIYPARNGHASYHMPKRWRRFGGLGDDVCGGDGIVWRPSPVHLDHPGGRTPPWLQFRGRYGGTRSIASEGFWKGRGEAPRRCSTEAKYRSLLEEGLIPDRGVRLGPSRRMLHGNADRGVWLERHRQTQNRVPLINTWTRVPGVSTSRPRDEDPPRSADRVWLADWAFLRDFGGGTTDAQGWSYHNSQAEYADTGISGRPKDSGLLVHRSRGRVWFRVAATPQVAREVEEARRLDGERHPRGALALAALDVAGRGDVTVTSASVLQTLRDGVDRHGATTSSAGAREGTASSSTSSGDGWGVLLGSPRELAADRSPEENRMSFGSVAKRNIGGS